MLVACGRVDFATRSDGDLSTGPDAVPDAAFPTGPFGAPVPIAELNTTGVDDDPSLTDDMLELYFASDVTGTQLVMKTTRASVTDPWATPVEVAEITSGGNSNNCKVSGDGLMLLFTSTRSPNVGGVDIWVTARADRSSPWGIPQPVDEVVTATDDFEPSVDAEQLTLYFASQRSGGPSDLWHATRATRSDSWGSLVRLAAVSSSSYDGGPWIDRRDLVLYWHSDRDASRDLFMSMRNTPAELFTTTAPMTELNSSFDEQDPWLSADGHTFIFVSDRTGDADLYITTR